LILRKMSKVLICVFICLFVVTSTLARTTVHELRDKHEKRNKTAEEQAEFDKEVLLRGGEEEEDGGDEENPRDTIHDMDEEEQVERLKKFVTTKMDTNKDNFVDKDELMAYTKKAMAAMHVRELKEEFANLDSDKDGEITYKEFSTEMYGDEEQNNNDLSAEEKEHHQQMVESDKKLFGAADKNGDGKLSESELQTFRYPTTSEETKKVSLEKTLSEHDTNKNGAIDVEEYINHLKKDTEDDDEASWIPYEQEKFKTDLDTDKDGVLKGDEILKWSGPMNADDQAKGEVEHLIKECDVDHDGKLTLEEILDNHQIWLHTEATNFGHHLTDEL